MFEQPVLFFGSQPFLCGPVQLLLPCDPSVHVLVVSPLLPGFYGLYPIAPDVHVLLFSSLISSDGPVQLPVLDVQPLFAAARFLLLVLWRFYPVLVFHDVLVLLG